MKSQIHKYRKNNKFIVCKNLFHILVLFFAMATATAQNDMTAEATMQRPDWNNLLSNLNTAQITSGILIDKVVDFSKLQNFNVATNIIFDSS